MKETENQSWSAEEEAACVEELCYSFSRLLYDLIEDQRREYDELLQEKLSLERKCREYEERLQQGGNVSARAVRTRIAFSRRLEYLKIDIKTKLFSIAQKFFSFGRRVTGRLGIKEFMKRSSLFRKLYAKGTIDRLRK